MFLLYRVHSPVGCASPGLNPTGDIRSRTRPPGAESLYESTYYPAIRVTFRVRVLFTPISLPKNIHLHKLYLSYIHYVTICCIILYFLLFIILILTFPETINSHSYIPSPQSSVFEHHQHYHHKRKLSV